MALLTKDSFFSESRCCMDTPTNFLQTRVCLVSIAKSKHPVLLYLIVKPGANSAIIGFQ